MLRNQMHYDRVFSFTWDSLASTPLIAAAAGLQMYDQLLAQAASIPKLQKNDVIDVHLVGHSRGSSVIDQALLALLSGKASSDGSLSPSPQIQHGWYKLTFLDPHPATNLLGANVSFSTLAAILVVYDPLAYLLSPDKWKYFAFQKKVQDPLIVVPARVNQIEDYYQRNGTFSLKVNAALNGYRNTLPGDLALETQVINLQGIPTSQMAIADRSTSPAHGTLISEYNLTSLGLGHSDIHTWYINLLSGATSLPATPMALAPASSDPSPAIQLQVSPLLGNNDSGNVLTNSPSTIYVWAEDSQGNLDDSFNGPVTLMLDDNANGGSLDGTLTTQAVNGVAVFSNVSVTKPGSNYAIRAFSGDAVVGTSLPFDVTNEQLVVTTAPPSSLTTADTFGLVVKAEDASGTVDTSFQGSVTLAQLGGAAAALGGNLSVNVSNGVATFTGLSFNQAETYGLIASSQGLDPAVTDTIVVSAALATQLVVTEQPPAAVTAGATFAVQVTAEDSAGNVDPSFNGSVTLALSQNPGNSTMSNVTVSAMNGVATFSGLTLDQAANGYALQANANGLTAANTNLFDVRSAGTATTLVIVTQPPGSVTAGAKFGFVVQAEDSNGTLDQNFSGQASIALANNPTGTNLGGTLTIDLTQGAATSSDLTIDPAGSGYALQVSCTGLDSATTDPFAVTATNATQLAVLPPINPVVAGVPFAIPIAAEDPFKNIDTTFSGSMSISLMNNPGNSTLGGTLMVPVANGTATLSGLTISNPGSAYTVSVSGNGLSQTSSPFDVGAAIPQHTLSELENTITPTALQLATLLGSQYSDPDKNTKPGIAVVQLVGNGTWQYSTNGVSWLAMKGVANGKAVLLPKSYRLRFLPAANWNGQAELLYCAWDGSIGRAGSLMQVVGTGGAMPFSAEPGSVVVNVTPINIAPTWTATTAYLTPVLPGTYSLTGPVPPGDTVAGVFGSFFSDVDGDIIGGGSVAIVSTTGTANGTWQYSTDGGTTWTSFGAAATTFGVPSLNKALLLSASYLIRFVPKVGIVGTATLGAYAWDGTQGTAAAPGATKGFTIAAGEAKRHSARLC